MFTFGAKHFLLCHQLPFSAHKYILVSVFSLFYQHISKNLFIFAIHRTKFVTFISNRSSCSGNEFILLFIPFIAWIQFLKCLPLIAPQTYKSVWIEFRIGFHLLLLLLKLNKRFNFDTSSQLRHIIEAETSVHPIRWSAILGIDFFWHSSFCYAWMHSDRNTWESNGYKLSTSFHFNFALWTKCNYPIMITEASVRMQNDSAYHTETSNNWNRMKFDPFSV